MKSDQIVIRPYTRAYKFQNENGKGTAEKLANEKEECPY